MKLTITIIIILIYVITHIVSALAKQAAKRKAQERQRQMAERRRIEAGGALTPPTVAGPQRIDPMFGGQTGTLSPAPLPTTPRTGKPMDDLTARRREQLDQLRQRREGRRTGQQVQRPSGPPTRAGPASDPFAASRVEEQQRRARELETARREQERAALRKREAETQRRRDQARKSAQKAEQARREVEQVRQQAVAPQSPTLGSIIRAQRRPAFNYGKALRDRATLRQLFVLKELIDPPLSLRETGP